MPGTRSRCRRNCQTGVGAFGVSVIGILDRFEGLVEGKSLWKCRAGTGAGFPTELESLLEPISSSRPKFLFGVSFGD